jgi:hypothetical protein
MISEQTTKEEYEPTRTNNKSSKIKNIDKLKIPEVQDTVERKQEDTGIYHHIKQITKGVEFKAESIDHLILPMHLLAFVDEESDELTHGRACDQANVDHQQEVQHIVNHQLVFVL